MKLRRIRAIALSVTAVAALAMVLTTFNSDRMTGNAASLKHIEEIIAESGDFNILEIVPDVKAASFGYYIDGQEPISSSFYDTCSDGTAHLSGWKATLSKMTSPGDRRAFVNGLFTRLAAKGILGSDGTTPLRYDYYDGENYYAEAYLTGDPQNWSTLPLKTTETVDMTGTFTPAEGGAFRAEYAYAPAAGDDGAYVQNILYFSYTPEAPPVEDAYYYNPVFSLITPGTDLTDTPTMKWSTTAVYTELKDGEGINITDANGRNIYVAGQYRTVKEILDNGGFNASVNYYYVSPVQTGAPGAYSQTSCYAAIADTTDQDDAPGDGFTSPPMTGDPAVPGPSYFTRDITSYTYVGDGGNYAFSDAGTTAYRVNFKRIFYKAGFKNNNLFKQHVLGLADPDNNPELRPDYGALDVTVTVKQAGEVTPSDIAGAEMVYISAGTDITDENAVTGYASADLPDAAAVALYNAAAALKPVILDYAIIRGLTETSPVSRTEKLCLLCLQPGIAATEVTSLSALTVDWPGLDYVAGDIDRTFVSNNIYCFNVFNTAGAVPDPETPGPGDIFTLATGLFTEAFSQEVYTGGFSDVLTVIQDENFLKQIAGQTDLLLENVTVSASVRHIINYMGRRLTNPKTSITVLDLEPAKVTTTGLTKATVRSWIGATQQSFPDSQIKIVRMTTGEFIGKIEDINETYDMIYIGMSTESFNMKDGKTNYNDNNMDGLIYTGIGDIYKGTFEMAGIREQDYVTIGSVTAISGGTGSTANQFRFSGNDITKTKVTELKKYAQAGYPIILADGLVSESGINTNLVDNSSYMYEALSGIYGRYANVIVPLIDDKGLVSNAETIIRYLNVSKPAISLTEKPVEYADDGNTSIAPDPDDGYYYLNYVFSISNSTDPTPVSTTYDCRLYIDINADGRYAPNEKLDDISVRRVSDGALVLPKVRPDTEQEYYLLSADIEYQVTRQMPQNYVGIIPWKLEVIKNGADQIHASTQGFTRIAAGVNKQTVRVLQMMKQGTLNSDLNLNKQLSSSPQGIYGQLISNLADFNVSIDVIETNVLESKGTGADPVKVILDYLKTYDMLIIGFKDMYDGIGEKAAPAIVRYINLGKSVLFTHDTTSMSQVPYATYPLAVNSGDPYKKTLNSKDVVWNSVTREYRSVDGVVSKFGNYNSKVSLPGGYTLIGTYNGAAYSIGGVTWYPGTALPFLQKDLYRYNIGSNKIPSAISDWGYYFNTVIRDAVGLDRYGVTSLIDTGGGLELGDIVNVNAPLPAGSIATILEYNRSVAYAPKSGRSMTVNEYQGYTNYALIRFAPGGSTMLNYTNNTYSNRVTSNVSQVNKGQITTYPYNVNTAAFGGTDSSITGYGGSYMQIGETHEQYFQINMNTDDIVVWYCLSSGGTDNNSYYDDVPNDCINAYYIYNRGNVTYSGVGHTSDAGKYGPAATRQYVNEAKLFVNTMIAAYQSAFQAPGVSIKKDARGTSDASSKYVLTDAASVLPGDLGPTDESRAVYYRLFDPNVGMDDKWITVEYYVADAGGSMIPGIGEPVLPLASDGAGGMPLTTFNTNGVAVPMTDNYGVMETRLKGGYVYKIYLPYENCLERLGNESVYSVRIYVKVTTTIGSTQLAPAVDFIEIKKQQLFELT